MIGELLFLQYKKNCWFGRWC